MENEGTDWFQPANDMGSVRERSDERVLFWVKRVVNRRILWVAIFIWFSIVVQLYSLYRVEWDKWNVSSVLCLKQQLWRVL
jgi:hypothetical protein